MKLSAIQLLLITTTTALDLRANRPGGRRPRARAGSPDACDAFAPCTAPVQRTPRTPTRRWRACGCMAMRSSKAPARGRWLEGAGADGRRPAPSVRGSTAAPGRPDTLYGGYGGRTAVYVDIRWDERGRTLPLDCGAAALALDARVAVYQSNSLDAGVATTARWFAHSCVVAERLATRLLDAARVPAASSTARRGAARTRRRLFGVAAPLPLRPILVTPARRRGRRAAPTPTRPGWRSLRLATCRGLPFTTPRGRPGSSPSAGAKPCRSIAPTSTPSTRRDG